MNPQTLQALPLLPSMGNTSTLLRRAVELLTSATRQGGLDALTRERIDAFLDEVAGKPKEQPVDPSDAATVTETPRLAVVKMPLEFHQRLENALKSKRVGEQFKNLHDFMLTAARGATYQSKPTILTLSGQQRQVTFTQAEFEELRPKVLEAGLSSTEDFILGCVFSWLESFRKRWPGDKNLQWNETTAADVTPIEVHRF